MSAQTREGQVACSGAEDWIAADELQTVAGVEVNSSSGG